MISRAILDTVSSEVDTGDAVQRAVAFSALHFGIDGAGDVDAVRAGFTACLTQKETQPVDEDATAPLATVSR